MYKITYNIITNLKYIKNIHCFLCIKTLSFSANPDDDDNMICFVKKDIGIQKKSSWTDDMLWSFVGKTGLRWKPLRPLWSWLCPGFLYHMNSDVKRNAVWTILLVNVLSECAHKYMVHSESVLIQMMVAWYDHNNCNLFLFTFFMIGQLNHACAVTFMMVLNFIWIFLMIQFSWSVVKKM